MDGRVQSARHARPQRRLAIERLEERTLLSGDFGFAFGLGSSDVDRGLAAVADGQGNVYVTGRFTGTADFDPGPTVLNLTSAGGWDIFVAKYSRSGVLQWAHQMGSTAADVGWGITLDAQGNVYTTGSYAGTADFDPGAGVANLSSAGLTDIFVQKLTSGGGFVWARSMGGAFYDVGLGVAVDAQGNVHTTGYFSSIADFDPGGSAANLVSAGNEDAFVSKLNAAGNFVWAKAFSGVDSAAGTGIAVDSAGNVYTTGYFYQSVDFNPGPGVNGLASAGQSDVFLCKLDGSGSFAWVRGWGSTGTDEANGLAADVVGNLAVAGSFEQTVDFDPGAGITNGSSAGSTDAFVSRFDSSGNLHWVRTIGGSGSDAAAAVVLGAQGKLHVAGLFAGSVDFDPSSAAATLASYGGTDGFVLTLDRVGTFRWAGSMGGALNDGGQGIAVNPFGDVFTTGYFEDVADFDPGLGAVNVTSAGSGDAYVSMLTQELDRIGVFRSGSWFVDRNGNFLWDGTATDGFFPFGLAPDAPVVGDWDSDGFDDIGVFRSGVWFLDVNGNRQWDVNVDAFFRFGAATDIPVIGDWNGDGFDDWGTFRNGTWYLDSTRDGVWGPGDVYFTFGLAGDLPVVGDWNGDGFDEWGVFRGGQWSLDIDRNGAWNTGDVTFGFGSPGDKPFVGDFSGDGFDDWAVFRNGYGFIDANRNGVWDPAADRLFQYGMAGDKPVVGNWDTKSFASGSPASGTPSGPAATKVAAFAVVAAVSEPTAAEPAPPAAAAAPAETPTTPAGRRVRWSRAVDAVFAADSFDAWTN